MASKRTRVLLVGCSKKEKKQLQGQVIHQDVSLTSVKNITAGIRVLRHSLLTGRYFSRTVTVSHIFEPGNQEKIPMPSTDLARICCGSNIPCMVLDDSNFKGSVSSRFADEANQFKSTTVIKGKKWLFAIMCSKLV
jgi:hypothetical protein